MNSNINRKLGTPIKSTTISHQNSNSYALRSDSKSKLPMVPQVTSVSHGPFGTPVEILPSKYQKCFDLIFYFFRQAVLGVGRKASSKLRCFVFLLH
jgi:hypothetical protein